MLNTKLIAELIEKGEFSGVKEAMEKSMAEGSQTFEQAIANLIVDGTVTRKEGILLYRLADQPDVAPARTTSPTAQGRRPSEHREEAGRRTVSSPKSRWT